MRKLKAHDKDMTKLLFCAKGIHAQRALGQMKAMCLQEADAEEFIGMAPRYPTAKVLIDLLISLAHWAKFDAQGLEEVVHAALPDRSDPYDDGGGRITRLRLYSVYMDVIGQT